MESERKRGGAGRLHLSAVSAEAEARINHVMMTHLSHVDKSAASHSLVGYKTPLNQDI